ncbi:hypothetical protein NIES22_60660 [Calothrix brevissima NIES-22]|nr:hypothetical protein NIES22_60660 [Calothrix brevissima NIES-22]
MDSFSRLPDFIKSSNNIKTVLRIGEQPPEPLPRLKAQERGSPEITAKPKQFYVTELLPVFSHLNFLLIETLAETQHGELIISSKKAKYETIVELGGHISHRYKLSSQDLQEIQQLHHFIIENWIVWRQLHKGK